MPNHLERLIKQRIPFPSDRIKAEVGFMYIAYQMQDIQQHFFKPYGITMQQYNTLRILRGQFPRPANINLIKDRMIDRMSDASRIVDRLVKLELVTKQHNTMDKRHVDVIITEKALNLLGEIDEALRAAPSLLDALEEAEINTLNHIIDRLLEKLD